MEENRHPLQHPLIVSQAPLAEKKCLRCFSVLSALIHITVIVLSITWIGGKTKVLPPVHVITVDLPRMNTTPEPPTPPVVQGQPRSARKLPPVPAQLKARALPETPTTPAAALPAVSQGQTGVTSFKTPAYQPGPTMPASIAPPAALPYRAPAGRPADNTSIRTAYMQQCRGLIERYKEYPIMARKGRIEGTVHLHGLLRRDGVLGQCVIARSSGSALLDNAALRAVRSVRQFPPVPSELKSDKLLFELPISFKLSAE